MSLPPTTQGQQHPSRPTQDHKEQLEAALVKLIRSFAETRVDPQSFWRPLSKALCWILKHIAPQGHFHFIKLLCGNVKTISIDLEVWPPS
jgi:hypothetical protein